MSLIKCTIGELFDNVITRYGQKCAVVYKNDQFTWKEMDILSDIYADRFAEAGITIGDHVGIFSRNSAAWIITFVALQKIGAVPALLNVLYAQRELTQAMEIGDIEWLLYGDAPIIDEDPGVIRTAVSKLSFKTKGTFDIRDASIDLRAMLLDNPEYSRKVKASPDPGDVALILYTTGTTSAPKCVLHDHISMVNNCIATADRAGINGEDRICLSQPLFHAFPACSALLASFYTGAMLCVLSSFHSKDILEWVEKNKCTVLNGVPTNFVCMYTNPCFKDYNTESLRLSMIGGAPISGPQIESIREALPTVKIMRNYGLTEGCNLCNTEHSDSNSVVARSVGRPYPDIEVAIMDPDTREMMPVGEKGEIVARGYNVMLGYYNSKRCKKPAVSSIDEDGWLHTGDIGIRDEEGHISVVGRIKDIIIRGGENVSPGEINGEIMRYEPILDSIVVGTPHPIMGEEIAACMVLDSPEDYSEEELKTMLKFRIAKFKTPKYFLIYDEFPLKGNGKVDMLALKKDVNEKTSLLQKNEKRCSN